MGTDAVFVFHIRPGALPVLAARVPDGLRVLDEHTALWSTYVRFPRSEMEMRELAAALTATVGDVLREIHDDPRGVLAYPDVTHPVARSYDAIVREVEDASLWIEPLGPAELERLEAETNLLVEALGRVTRAVAGMPAEVSTQARVDRAMAEFTAEELVELDAHASRQGSADFRAALISLLSPFHS